MCVARGRSARQQFPRFSNCMQDESYLAIEGLLTNPYGQADSVISPCLLKELRTGYSMDRKGPAESRRMSSQAR
jgi:hypothetical protein